MSKPLTIDAWKLRVHKKRWKTLDKMGIKPPKDKKENADRAKAAHGY